MGNYNLKRLLAGGFTLLILGSIALVPFTNCSQNPQNASTPQTAFLSPTEKYEALKEEFKGRVPLSFCQTSEAYGCMKRIYSAEVESGEMIMRQECASVSSDLNICPVTQTFQFNSKAAEENCNGCKETYEYLEYDCHLKIPNSENIYPITATKPTMGQSILDLYEFCAAIAEESK